MAWSHFTKFGSDPAWNCNFQLWRTGIGQRTSQGGQQHLVCPSPRKIWDSQDIEGLGRGQGKEMGLTWRSLLTETIPCFYEEQLKFLIPSKVLEAAPQHLGGLCSSNFPLSGDRFGFTNQNIQEIQEPNVSKNPNPPVSAKFPGEENSHLISHLISHLTPHLPSLLKIN